MGHPVFTALSSYNIHTNMIGGTELENSFEKSYFCIKLQETIQSFISIIIECFFKANAKTAFLKTIDTTKYFSRLVILTDS